MDSLLVNKPSAGAEAVILIHSLNGRGGTEIVAINLAEALRAAGVTAQIVCVEPYTGPEREYVSWINPDVTDALMRRYGRIRLAIAPGAYHRAMRKVIDNVARSLDTRLLVNFTYENLAMMPNPFGTPYRTAAVYHWSVRGYEESLMGLARRKNTVRRLMATIRMKRLARHLHLLMAHTDYAVALTDAGAEELRTLNYALCGNRIKVIPNFLPYDGPADNNCTGHTLRAVYVGRLSVEKGIYRLPEIWRHVLSRIPDAHLDIYGEGTERDGLERVITEAGLCGSVTFRGFESDARRIYEDADTLLCTSDSEGFGMVLVEAMHYGVVPVTFDCPVSPAELVADAGTAVTCYDTIQFADAVTDILTASDTDLTRRRQLCRRRAADFYRPNVIRQWIKLIRNK